MDHRFPSGNVELAAHLAVPTGNAGRFRPAVVLCHGFPAGAGGAATSAQTFPELADRIAADLDFVALTFNFRGCGRSGGDFSLSGWMADLAGAIDHVTAQPGVRDVWLAGADSGGSLAVCHAGHDRRVRGVATLGAPVDFEDWAGNPRRFLDHARSIGAVKSARFPPAVDAWAREFRELRPLDGVRALAPRPLLVIHGLQDDVVPSLDGRVLADAHGAAELRLLSGAGHRLRHDPRAVAVLLGWLDRQRHRPRQAAR